MSAWSDPPTEPPAGPRTRRPRPLTEVQVEVLDLLDAAYPSAMTTLEIVERRTGARYDGNRTYRALRGLEARGIVAGFRSSAMLSVSWAVIR